MEDYRTIKDALRELGITDKDHIETIYEAIKDERKQNY